MISIVEKGICWQDPNSQIIFNPVSISKREGKELFNPNLKHDYPEVYDNYLDYMIGVSKKRLLGDVQLIQIEEKKFILNGYVMVGRDMNIKALTKALVELSNLAEEYHLSIALTSNLGCNDQENAKTVENVIRTIFGDFHETVYIYKKKPRHHKKQNI